MIILTYLFVFFLLFSHFSFLISPFLFVDYIYTSVILHFLFLQREKSPVLKSFIDLLLKPKISSRPSASDALRHPFLAGEIETVDTPARLKLKESASETFEKMKAFSSYPDIKRAALMAIAHKLHTNEIGGLREAFQKIDTKHTGTKKKRRPQNVVE